MIWAKNKPGRENTGPKQREKELRKDYAAWGYIFIDLRSKVLLRVCLNLVYSENQ